jgi:tetratricopeptide (TPR) repeat protein
LAARARALETNQDFRAAAADYHSVTVLDPRDADAFGQQGEAWRNASELARAQKCLDTSVQMNSNNPYARHCRGVLALQKGELEIALNDFDECIRLNRKLLERYEGSLTGDQAVHWTRLSLAHALDQRGSVKYRMQDYPGASRDAREALNLEFVTGEAHNILGRIALERADKANDANAISHCYLGELLVELALSKPLR